MKKNKKTLTYQEFKNEMECRRFEIMKDDNTVFVSWYIDGDKFTEKKSNKCINVALIPLESTGSLQILDNYWHMPVQANETMSVLCSRFSATPYNEKNV